MNAASLGLFDAHTDIGDIRLPGSASLRGDDYAVSGSGHNMWGEADAFHFVWARVDGDRTLSANIEFVGEGAEPHRKACLVVRQSLEADSAYADIAVHGDGLTSLQYRDQAEVATREVVSPVSGPRSVSITRRGDYVFASAGGEPIGGAVRIEFPGPYYIGLAVCSHSRETTESAVFSNVVLEAAPSPDRLVSILEVLTVEDGTRHTVRTFDRHIEAPNWARDDRLIVNGGGRLYSIPSGGGDLTQIGSGFADACNNDHGLSPDGSRIAISDQSQGDRRSVIYTIPVAGGEPQRLTDGSPSYWHGWSPDGGTIAFCGERDGAFGIFTIPAAGGPETRLTTAPGLDDGPEYSPDGAWIYFNSDRSGLMQLYRVHPDGSGLERVTHDGSGNWFPHLSPDGERMVYLAYDASVQGHPADKDVELRLRELATGETRTVAKIFGGQGTINVPSWSPDGTRFAFVSYLYV